MSYAKNAQYNAYSQASQTVSKVRQVVMLYDGAIRYLQQAKEAIRENRIQDRYNLLVKASEVMLGLQGCLDFDAGNDVAKTLHDFYSSIDQKILSVHRSQDGAMCEHVIKELKDMREVWAKIDNEGNNAFSSDKPAAETKDPAPNIQTTTVTNQAPVPSASPPPSGVQVSA